MALQDCLQRLHCSESLRIVLQLSDALFIAASGVVVGNIISIIFFRVSLLCWECFASAPCIFLADLLPQRPLLYLSGSLAFHPEAEDAQAKADTEDRLPWLLQVRLY